MKIIMLVLMLSVMVPVGFAQEALRLGTIEISMMDECIDDMFSSCTTEMNEQVQMVYFPREIQDDLFREAWDASEPCAQQKLEAMQSRSKELTSNHARAICVYTNDEPNLYEPLNGALRTGAPFYSSPAFQYHALYFWLTSAIQILEDSCKTTYRRTPNVYSGKTMQKMRFGYFASSSRKPNLTEFGNETCFHIKTCFGAYIEPYSIIEGEDEVLIPPYEVFQVMKIVANSYGDLNNCTKIFVLESVAYRSALNCKAANHNQQIRANFPFILGFQLLIGLLWNNCPDKTL